MTQALPVPDVPALLRRARRLVDQGRLAAARPLLSAAARIGPPTAALWEMEARLLLREGDTAAALAMLDRALSSLPGTVDLLLCRAGARAGAGEIAGALADAADAVLAAPQDVRAKALLGAVLLQAERPGEAQACLAEALAAQPDDIPTRLALARAQELCGTPGAAAATLAEGVARAPSHVGLRTQSVLFEARRGAFAVAVRLAEAARREGCADACVLGLLGHALSSLGRHAEATAAYAEALKLAPEDRYVRHLVAAAGLVTDMGRAPAEYVRVVFDGYAARFDAHLIGLGYRVPGLARAELAAAAPAGPVLDLGCGTGLMALALSDLVPGPYVGVDLSPRMLAVAAQRGLYAELHEADIVAFLGAGPRRFPLILAGDVLPYFGDLGALLCAVAARLAPGGRFICSAELLEGAPPPWRLGPLGRYRHAPAHLVAAAGAAGLEVVRLRPEVIRREEDAPVAGLFAVLEAASA